LYDATGVPLLDGGGLVCSEAAPVVCGGACSPENATHCGESCLDCTLASDIPPNAVAACVVAPGAAPGTGTCGFECGDGLMRCGATSCCPVTAVAAGERFTCALASDGTPSSGAVSCWGANDAGQLGDGTAGPSRAVPGRVALSGPATAIGTGAKHACAVVGGAVRCWGANEAGQVTGSASGAHHSESATPVTSGAVAVVAGASHTCALLAGGAVRCWGAAGLIGDAGDPFHDSGATATALAAGRSHTCALVAGGAVQCWGANGSGQLGNGSTAPSTTAQPVLVNGGSALAAMQFLSAGADQTCAATENPPLVGGVEAAVRCWGDSLGDSLGGVNDFGFTSPQLIPAIPLKSAGQATIDRSAELVAAGRKHVCVRNRTEAIECFGANDRGQLGGTPAGGPTEAMTVPLPAAPPAAIASAIAAGADHTCAIVSGGRLRCWGANTSGQLGNGETTDPGIGEIVAPRGR
jgi:alpha-tubulin suppressor-like RCC1 family protein